MTITGTGFTGATAVDFGTTAATNVTVVSDTTITADSPAGTGTVDVTVTTPAGTSATSPADQFTYTAPCRRSRAEPDQRFAAGGTLVTITGTGFTGATAVDFGTTAATRRHGRQRHHDHGRQPGGHRHRGRDRDHPGRARRPPRPPISSPTPAAPTVTGLSPTSGPAAGGTLVTITGTGFTGATAVDFGTTPATNVTVVNDTTITADSPAGTGIVDVTVTTPGGHVGHLAADQFTYTAAPDGHGPEPDQRSAGRRHLGDDHRHRLHRRHRGRLRHDGGDDVTVVNAPRSRPTARRAPARWT